MRQPVPSDAKMGVLIENSINKIKELFADGYLGSSQRSLRLKDVWAEDELHSSDVQGQLHAKLNDQTWGVPIKATIELMDHQTGKPIGKPSTVTLMRLPKLTDRFSFIIDGGEYQVDHLLRLRSGVYTRIKRNGDLVSEFNLARGGNKNFGLYLDRKKSLVNFQPKSSEAKVPAYPLLKVMGVSDEAIEQSWGKAVFAANRITNPEAEEKVLRRFYEKTGGKDLGRAPSLEEVKQHVYSYFDDTALRPETTKVTLGKPFTKVTGDALLSASSKLIKLEKKEVDADDRDSLIFKDIVHIEDFIPERLGKSRGQIKQKVRNAINNKTSISEILQGGDIFKRPIADFFMKGGNVSERGDQTNPVQMLSGNFKTTLVAKDYGGIKDAEKLGDEMRAINPSHFGFLDPMHTPESERTGITLHLGSGVVKDGNELKTHVYNLKTGRNELVPVQDFHEKTVVLADQISWKNGKPVPHAETVKVKLPGGDIGMRAMSEAHYVMPTAKSMFSWASNLIPFLQNDQGNRASMADKQIEQAISLKYREAPLVQSSVHQDNPEYTFEKHLGKNIASHKAPVAGEVVKVTPDEIHIKNGKETHKVQLYNHFPLNDPAAMLHSTVLVKPGDQVKANQVLADSNFSKNGTLALGTNLRVGYIPYKGYNFEDGIVISEGASQRLTSEHLHKLKLDIDTKIDRTSKASWKAHSSRKAAGLGKDQWDALDDDGVVREGTVVRPGQILVTALTPNVQKSDVRAKAFGPSRAGKAWRDKSLTWDSDYVGTVARVVKSPNGGVVHVHIKTEEPAEIGDKLSGRHGNKGIITKILKNEEMPFTVDAATGERRHMDVLLNPSGIPTRINPGQVLETAAAKIAEKTGKPYFVNNFTGAGHDYRQMVVDDLKKHGLTDEELVYDPSDVRKPLGSVLVGPQHLLKLKHQVEKKLVVRGGESDLEGRQYGYDYDMQPYKGGAHGGQGFGALELYSLLGHNARHNLREMSTYKSDMQGPDFWALIHEGRQPRPPKIPFSYQKFEGLLKGLGVDVRKEGTNLRMVPMTDKETLKLCGDGKNEITQPKLLMSKGFKEEKGGFFDPQATGGLGGTKWAHLKLTEPMPNPVFVGEKQSKGPIPALLSLNHGDIAVQDIDAIMAGKKTLNGKIGGAAIHDALKAINVDEAIKHVRIDLAAKRGSKKDQLHRTLKYLLALKDLGLKPHEAYVMNHLPVLPPVFRPLTLTSRGNVAGSKLNDLYHTLAINNDELRKMDPNRFGPEIGNELRDKTWNSLKALQSVGDYKSGFDETTHEPRAFKGLIDMIGGGEGEQPKQGYFQEHLIKRKQDLSIRSTIVPEPTLHIDEVGVPLRAAMELYKPFVIGKLHSKYSYRPGEAMDELKTFSDRSKAVLQEVMNERPLLLKRDPSLHKFNVMAFRPKIVEGKAIKIHPLVCGGFNADFDGDTMAGTIPVSQAAVEEAMKMFPSKNLFSPASYRAMHIPNQEFLLGLNLATQWGKKTDHSFATLKELKKAHENHKIGLTDVVSLGGKPTTVGRALIVEGLPAASAHVKPILNDPKFVITAGVLRDIVGGISKNHPEKFDQVVNHLKDVGVDQSFKEGFSLGLKDFATLPERDRILAAAKKEADHVHRTVKDATERDAKLVSLWTKATKALDDASEARFTTPGASNRLAQMVYSGSRGKKEQLRQMVSAPILVQDATGRTLPNPVTRSYGEGLDLGDYWLSQHGARKGTLNRASGTREPGAMTKDIINSTISTLITSNDCKTNHGISMSLDPKDPYHGDIYDRFLAKDHGPYKAGELITPAVVDHLRKTVGKDAKIQVRSPLKCQHGSGICAKCFGLNENGTLHPMGTNIGVLAGQSLGEPATQLAMDAFHTGGVASGAGGSSVSRIERLKQLLKMPKTLKGSAILAKTDGPVTSIKPHHLGGHLVTIGGIDHHVREGEINPALKIGSNVRRGASLSNDLAPVHPKELLHVTKDMHEVQRYLVDELYTKLYKDEHVRPRNIELVVRSLTNLTRVKDPGHSHWEMHDVVPHSEVEEFNREHKGQKNFKPIIHEPILKGSGEIPRHTEDWMSRLNYQRLGETIQRGAAMAWKSDIHGTHPIPGIAYGAEFGPHPTTPPGKKPYVY